MVPIKTSIEDMRKALGYIGKQIGWVDQPKIEKALGPLDDRKVGAMVEFGLLLRDGVNLRATDRGQQFNADEKVALSAVLRSVEFYRATLEWVHYGKRSETTAAEIAQYWESSHADTLGGLKGSTLKDGAVCFGRVVDGAGLGTFTIGRAGKETRVSFDLTKLTQLVDGDQNLSPQDTSESTPEPGTATQPTPTGMASTTPVVSETQSLLAPSATPSITVATSPSVHVNVEIHIAADATADTVREIFKNMARYVLDKPIADDGE